MVEEKHEGAEYRVKRLVWFIVILLVIFFFADKVFPAALKNRLLLKFEICKIIPLPQKRKHAKKGFPQQHRFVSLPLSKSTGTYRYGQREDSKKPYSKPTQLPQSTVSKSHSPSRGRSHSGNYSKCLALYIYIHVYIHIYIIHISEKLYCFSWWAPHGALPTNKLQVPLVSQLQKDVIGHVFGIF